MATTATDASVEIKYDPKGNPPLVLTPPEAPISGPGTATWTARDCVVTIVFNDKQGSTGPFPPKGTTDNPTDGVYNCLNTPVTSLPASYGTNGRWSYTVTLDGTANGGAIETNGVIVVKGNPPEL